MIAKNEGFLNLIIIDMINSDKKRTNCYKFVKNLGEDNIYINFVKILETIKTYNDGELLKQFIICIQDKRTLNENFDEILEVMSKTNYDGLEILINSVDDEIVNENFEKIIKIYQNKSMNNSEILKRIFDCTDKQLINNNIPDVLKLINNIGLEHLKEDCIDILIENTDNEKLIMNMSQIFEVIDSMNLDRYEKERIFNKMVKVDTLPIEITLKMIKQYSLERSDYSYALERKIAHNIKNETNMDNIRKMYKDIAKDEKGEQRIKYLIVENINERLLNENFNEIIELYEQVSNASIGQIYRVFGDIIDKLNDDIKKQNFRQILKLIKEMVNINYTEECFKSIIEVLPKLTQDEQRECFEDIWSIFKKLESYKKDDFVNLIISGLDKTIQQEKFWDFIDYATHQVKIKNNELIFNNSVIDAINKDVLEYELVNELGKFEENVIKKARNFDFEYIFKRVGKEKLNKNFSTILQEMEKLELKYTSIMCLSNLIYEVNEEEIAKNFINIIKILIDMPSQLVADGNIILDKAIKSLTPKALEENINLILNETIGASKYSKIEILAKIIVKLSPDLQKKYIKTIFEKSKDIENGEMGYRSIYRIGKIILDGISPDVKQENILDLLKLSKNASQRDKIDYINKIFDTTITTLKEEEFLYIMRALEQVNNNEKQVKQVINAIDSKVLEEHLIAYLQSEERNYEDRYNITIAEYIIAKLEVDVQTKKLGELIDIINVKNLDLLKSNIKYFDSIAIQKQIEKLIQNNKENEEPDNIYIIAELFKQISKDWQKIYYEDIFEIIAKNDNDRLDYVFHTQNLGFNEQEFNKIFKKINSYPFSKYEISRKDGFISCLIFNTETTVIEEKFKSIIENKDETIKGEDGIYVLGEFLGKISEETQNKYSIKMLELLDVDELNVDKNIFLIKLRNLKKETRENQFFTLAENESNIIKNENVKSKVIKKIFETFSNNDKIKYLVKLFQETEKYDKSIAGILELVDIKAIIEISKDINLNEDEILKIVKMNPAISTKILLFSNKVEKEKIIELGKYDKINNSIIDINSMLSKVAIHENENKVDAKRLNQGIDQLHRILLYKNVPEFIVDFTIFKYGNFYDTASKIKSYQTIDIKERDRIIFCDLFKITLNSNNRSLREFCNCLIRGKDVVKKLQVDYYKNKTYDLKVLNEEERAYLEQYIDTLFDLQNITIDMTESKKEKIKRTQDAINDLKELKKQYSSREIKNIFFEPHIILDELFGNYIEGEIRPQSILKYMNEKHKEEKIKNKRMSEEIKDKKVTLEEGDFIKGIPNFPAYLRSMSRSGIKAGEFNQEHSHNDATPLDADFGYISAETIRNAKERTKKENREVEDYDIILSSISRSFGNTWIVCKNYESKFKENEEQKGKKDEKDFFIKLFDEYWTGDETRDRYLRTGIGRNDIDYIITNEWKPWMAYEFAMEDWNVAVKDINGKELFSQKDFEKIKSWMKGLSYYGEEEYDIAPETLQIEEVFNLYRQIGTKEEEEILKEIEQVKQILAGEQDFETTQKKKSVLKYILNYFAQNEINVTDNLSDSLSSNSIELIDTGSTGRGTNVPGDGDFDFMLRHNITDELLEGLKNYVSQLPNEEFENIQDGLRAKKCVLPDGQVADIDITYATKDLGLEYSSDMCVRDRLNSIKLQHPESYNYVIANIIMAKKILKSIGLYKAIKSKGHTEYGGFGGIGVENWILQNGGSFKKALETYMEATKDENGNEVPYIVGENNFVDRYPIFDFGYNQRDVNCEHDKYSGKLGNCNEIGFIYAKEKFKGFLKMMELSKENVKDVREDEEIQNNNEEQYQEIAQETNIREIPNEIEKQEEEKEEEKSILRQSISIEGAKNIGIETLNSENYIYTLRLVAKLNTRDIYDKGYAQAR